MKTLKFFLIGLFLFMVINVGILQPREKSYNYNLEYYTETCQRIFGNQLIEMVVFFTAKNNMCVQTSNYAEIIILDISALEIWLKNNGESIEDIVFIIHNHLYPGNFSTEDKKMFLFFVGKGFRGLFCIWYQGKISRILVPMREG